MTLLRKYYELIADLPTGGGIPDEERIEKAYQLLVKKSKEAYLSSGSFSASPFGLDGIPHVRRDAISKLMVEFSDSELSFASEELARLKEENERLRGEVEKTAKYVIYVLQENHQAQIAGYYNDDKTDVEREKRNAVIEEYSDLIGIFKANLPLSPTKK